MLRRGRRAHCGPFLDTFHPIGTSPTFLLLASLPYGVAHGWHPPRERGPHKEPGSGQELPSEFRSSPRQPGRGPREGDRGSSIYDASFPLELGTVVLLLPERVSAEQWHRPSLKACISP